MSDISTDRKLRIAIDGPGGAGKSTISKLTASKLGLEYVDTGAMYRAIALKILETSTDLEDIPAVSRQLEHTEISFSNGHITLDGEDVEDGIRTTRISRAASAVAAIPQVRKKLVSMQRQIAEEKNVVMDGRDIGTNVIKDAELKIFLTADPMVRAKRRYDELIKKNPEADTSFEQVYQDICDRDYRDTHRELNPLTRAEDAVLVDTSDMTIQQVVDRIEELASEVCRSAD